MKRLYMILIGLSVNLLVLLLVFGQQTAAQSAGEYDITLEAMGFQERTANGPKATFFYYFDLPAGWEIIEGSYLTLDIEYELLMVDEADYPSALLDIQFNENNLRTEQLPEPATRQLRIDLPPDYFREYGNSRTNVIQISFDDHRGCELTFLNSITIKNTSSLHLVYRENPWPIDLGAFPRPIYQRWAFESGQVQFVLPDQVDETDAQAATIIAARLGQLSANRLPISATLASEQFSPVNPEEHLIMIGKPDNNRLLKQLNLPIPLVERQLILRSQMPMTVSPGSILSYTLTVENTSTESQSLVVEDRVSSVGKFLNCGESCKPVADDIIRWEVGLLSAQQQASTTVFLRVKPANVPSTTLKHTATLFDSQENILNVNTQSTQIGETPDSRLIPSPRPQSTSFFVQGSEAVAEDAGVLQEIISPWSPRHVAVIVTGLTDEALLKAAHGLDPQNHYPGIWGESAIVEEMHPITHSLPTVPKNVTFASLGYGNADLIAVAAESRQYFFDFPAGATLDRDSYLALHISHAPSLSKIGGAIKVILNGAPTGSALLNEDNLNDAWLQIPLSRTTIRPGLNLIRIETLVEFVDACIAEENFWLTIYDDSFLHFTYTSARTNFSLDDFPYPFNRPGNMENVVFSLPRTPNPAEIEGLLRIASLIGSGSESKDLLPRITFGEEPDSNSLANSHLIALGLSTMNPVIRAANDALPQPFLPDSNNPYQRVDNPTYRITPGTDLGYVQTLVSPWGEGENVAFVIATGTTQAGVQMAISALTQTPNKLTGNLVMVRGENIYSTDTRALIAEEVFSNTIPFTSTLSETTAEEQPASSQVPEQTSTPVAASQQDILVNTPIPQQISATPTLPAMTPVREYTSPEIGSSRPWWLILLLVVSILTIIISVVFWIRRARL